MFFYEVYIFCAANVHFTGCPEKKTILSQEITARLWFTKNAENILLKKSQYPKSYRQN